MAVTTSEKTSTKARLMAETKTMLLVAVYLALLLGAFTAYRMLVLAAYEIDYFHFGFNFIEAFVLAKVIVLGRLFHLGERFDDRPLIVPTLYKTACFSVFVLLFTLLEHVATGFWHGKSTSAILEEIYGNGAWEVLARVLVLVTALAPLFAVWETGRVLGEGKLFEWFFKRRQRGTSGQSAEA